jgi:HicB-like protein involved in pilus formation
MQISVHVEALQRDLAAVAAVGNIEESETVQRIAAALEAALRLRLLEAITDAAHELTSQLDGHVEVRLVGGDPSLVYVEGEPEHGWQPGEDAFTARITLRLPGSLKASLEAVATREGISVNSWLVQAISRGLERRQSTRAGRRLTGYARS